MKTLAFVLAFSLTTVFGSPAFITGVNTYDVSWPDEYLQGTFTLDVGSDSGSYFSTAATGTYAWPGGTNAQAWIDVELNAQPTLTELRFYFEPGAFVGYAVSPSYVGKSAPWTSAAEAWQDLITRAASDGVYIAVVPEPPCIECNRRGVGLGEQGATKSVCETSNRMQRTRRWRSG